MLPPPHRPFEGVWLTLANKVVNAINEPELPTERVRILVRSEWTCSPYRACSDLALLSATSTSSSAQVNLASASSSNLAHLRSRSSSPEAIAERSTLSQVSTDALRRARTATARPTAPCSRQTSISPSRSTAGRLQKRFAQIRSLGSLRLLGRGWWAFRCSAASLNWVFAQCSSQAKHLGPGLLRESLAGWPKAG